MVLTRRCTMQNDMTIQKVLEKSLWTRLCLLTLSVCVLVACSKDYLTKRVGWFNEYIKNLK